MERAGDEWAFRHGIVRAALLRDQDPAELAGVHWAVGVALEDLHRADREPHLDEIAHHLRLGASAGDRVKASDSLADLGHRQFRALALDEAVASLTAALDVVPEADDDGRRRMAILETLAETHFWRDEPDAMRGPRSRPRTSPVASGRQKTSAARWSSRRAGTGAASSSPRSSACSTKRSSGWAAARAGPRAAARDARLRAPGRRTRLRDPEARGRRADGPPGRRRGVPGADAPRADLHRGGLADRRPDPADRRDLEEVAAQVLREDLRQHTARWPAAARALLQLMSGDRPASKATRRELGAIAEAMRATFIRSQMLHWDSAILRAEGRFDAADERSAAALANWSARPDDARLPRAERELRLERGEHEQVLPQIEQAVAGNTAASATRGGPRSPAGLAAVGRTAEAAARLEELGADKFRGLADDHQRPHALRWLAEAVARLGTRSSPRSLLPIAEPYAGLGSSGSGIRAVEAAADRRSASCSAIRRPTTTTPPQHFHPRRDPRGPTRLRSTRPAHPIVAGRAASPATPTPVPTPWNWPARPRTVPARGMAMLAREAGTIAAA